MISSRGHYFQLIKSNLCAHSFVRFSIALCVYCFPYFLLFNCALEENFPIIKLFIFHSLSLSLRSEYRLLFSLCTMLCAKIFLNYSLPRF